MKFNFLILSFLNIFYRLPTQLTQSKDEWWWQVVKRWNISTVWTVFVPLSAMKDSNQSIVELESMWFVEWLELEFCQDLINSKICMSDGDCNYEIVYNIFFFIWLSKINTYKKSKMPKHLSDRPCIQFQNLGSIFHIKNN